jgi:putative DNA primase/helicase
MNLRSLATALGGKAYNGYVTCPGPGHSQKDRSLSVWLDPAAPDGLRVYSNANDDWRECMDHVRERLGLPEWKPGPARFISPVDRMRMIEQRRAAEQQEKAEQATRGARALKYWDEAGPIGGTPAEAYLASRGLAYRGEALRWHPACPFDGDNLEGCMVALVRNALTGAPQAIHRTALTPDGRKIDRMALGPLTGGAIMLDGPEYVFVFLTVAEGIETALSASAMGLNPAWACISAGGIKRLPVIPNMDRLTIVSDNDANGVGVDAAHECADNWRAAGATVRIIMPETVGADLNDILTGMVAA